MADVRFVQGDTEPPITATLQRNGVIEDLTGATVRFQMRKADDRHYTVNGTAEFIGDPEDGNVKYVWGASDLNVPGDYIAQFEVTYPSGRIETSDPPNSITVRRQ